jgi:hypothetical protein
MAGGVRLGVGYTILALGLALGLIGGVLSGFAFHFEESETECHDHLIGGRECHTESSSASAEVVGTWLMVPGGFLVVASLPLVVTGHVARDQEQESTG